MNDMVDMSRFVEAKSDQLNGDDLIGSPRTITVTKVAGCDGDQPIAIYYQGDNGKPFKPCKTIRRVLLAIWGRNAADYVGRSMTLYRDDSVTFGGLNVGGIRVSHMSHLDKETVVVVMKTKGKKAGIKVLPLADRPAAPPADTKQAKAEEWLAWLKDELTGADQAKVKETFAKAEKTLARLKEGFPDLYAEAMKLAPTTEASSIDTLIAKIGAADSLEVDRLDKESDGDRAFMTPDEIDRLDQALAARREALRTPETVA